MELIVRPHVMSDRNRTVYQPPLGKTISELIEAHTEFDAKVRKNLVVLVNGEIEDNWNRIPNLGDTVTVAMRLHGGGDGKSILALVAMIVLAIFAPWAAGLMFSAGTAGYTAATMAIMMIGSMAINAIFAPPRAKAESTSPAENAGNTYSFGSQGNQARQFGAVMRVYGKHKVVPDVAGLPYTLNVGDDTYFYGLYCFGYGPLDLEEFKIGQTLLTNYTNYEVNVIEEYTDASQLKFYKADIWQENFRGDISKAVGPLTFTTRPLTDQAILDLVFQQGLVAINKKTGKYEVLTSSVKITVRDTLVPGSQFTPITTANGRPVTVSRGVLGGMFKGRMKMGLSNQNAIGMPYGLFFKNQSIFDVTSWAVHPGTDTPAIPGVGDYVRIAQYPMKVASINGFQFTTETGLPAEVVYRGTTEDSVDFQYVAPTIGPVATGEWTITENRGGSFNASIEFPLPYPSTWEFRVESLSDDLEDTDNYSYLWKRTVAALKSMKVSVPPLEPDVPVTVVELRIKATGQLNESVDEFTAVATSKLRVWRNGAWAIEPTRNPAWAYLDILTGRANARAVPDSRVDIEKIKSWALRNDQVAPNFTLPNAQCDVVIDRVYTMWELLQSISATGRAAPTMRDNKYSIIIDDETRTPVQMFSPRNSSNLQSTRSYMEGPHALRVKWIDPQANYGANSATVYRTGYSEANATVFEDIDTFGITSQEGAIRYGRYMMAQGLLRQERFTIDTDIENIICLRGDLVFVAHDVLMVGGETARVKAVDPQVPRIVLDAPLTLQFDDYEDISGNGTTYGIRVRKSNGDMTSIIGVLALNGTEITPITGASIQDVKVGDLLVYGKVESIVGQYTVDRVSPNADMAATISLEEYAPLVYQAEYTGVIPPYVPQQGASYQRGGVRQLTATIIEYVDDEIYPRCRIRLGWIPPQGTVMPVYYNVYNIRSDGAELFLGQTTNTGFTTEQIDMWILGGSTLVYAVRPVFESSGPGPSEQVEIMLPTRETKPPPNFDFFEVVALPSGLRKYNFAYTTTPRPTLVTGGEIRYYPGHGAPPVWDAMENLAGEYGTFPTSGVELSQPGAGEWTFGIRAVDQLGVLAEVPLFFTITLPRSINEGGSAEQDYTPPPTPTGFEASGFFTRLLIEQDDPEYSAGGGHQSSILYGVEYVAGDDEPVFAEASVIQEFTGNVAQVAADMGTTYRLWLKWRTRAGVESVVPAGGEHGLEVSTGEDVQGLLDALTGQITESQLYGDLADRIDLIDAGANIPGSVAARISALATTMETADLALATQINTVQSRVNVRPNLLVNGGFENGLTGWVPDVPAGWAFLDSGVWGRYASTGGGAGVTPAAGSLVSAQRPAVAGFTYTFSGDTFSESTTGANWLRIKFYNASNAVLSTTDGPTLGVHAFSNDQARRQTRAVQATAPVGAVNYTVEYIWTGKTGTGRLGIRLAKFEEGAKPATFYTAEGGQAAIAASVQVEATTRAQQTGDLYAQYTVKLDLNGYISGIGLASTVSNGVPSSSFAVRADTFYIASPTGPGIAPSMPFIVRTVATTIGGVAVPPGVYIQEAFIQNGTIVNAKIANATIEDAKILNLSAAKINTGFLSADRIQAGTITADKLTVGGGKNMLNDSQWLNRRPGLAIPSGWDYGSNVSAGGFYTQVTYPEWFPYGTQGVVMNQNTGREGGRIMYLQAVVPGIVPGKRYEFSCYSGAHRALVYTYIVWMDGNGNQLGATSQDFTVQNNSEKAGGKTLDLFKRIGCFGFAPAGASGALVRILKDDTIAGQANSFAFVCNPMFAEANSAQVEFSPYSPSGIGVVITPNGISTPTLASIVANLGYVTAGTVDITGDGFGGWGYIRSPGKWYDANPGWIFAREPGGNNFVSIVSGAARIQFNAAPAGNTASIDFPGAFYVDHTGYMEIRRLNVINTLNVAGGAVSTSTWAVGNMIAQLGISVPDGQTHLIELTAFYGGAMGSSATSSGTSNGYNTVRLNGIDAQIVPLSDVGPGGDTPSTVVRPPAAAVSLIALGPGYHVLTASMDNLNGIMQSYVVLRANIQRRP